MNQADQIKHLEELDKSLLDIIKSKSSDYAQSEDVLSNFKIVAKIIEVTKIDPSTPEGYCMLMVVLKIVRIWNLKSESKDPKNEPLLDSYKDLINYTKLSYLCELEEKDESK